MTCSPVSAVCPWRETQTDLGCSSPFQPCLYDSERAGTAFRSHHGEIQTWPVSQEFIDLFWAANVRSNCPKGELTNLNRPIGFIISPLPSGEQQTDNLLNIIARPKDEVHLLCATYNVLQESEGRGKTFHSNFTVFRGFNSRSGHSSKFLQYLLQMYTDSKQSLYLYRGHNLNMLLSALKQSIRHQWRFPITMPHDNKGSTGPSWIMDLPFAWTGTVGHVVAQHLFARAL